MVEAAGVEPTSLAPRSIPFIVRHRRNDFCVRLNCGFGNIVPSVYTPVLAKRSQNFRLADRLAADYSPQFGQHPVTACHANLT